LAWSASQVRQDEADPRWRTSAANAGMFGVINLNKPVGWTSRDVVNRVAHLVKPARAGHAGTLDPLAEGVLVVCVGPATRLVEYVQQMPKEYRATFLLGRRSASDDLETEVELLPEARRPTPGELDAALPQFIGTIEQRPPAYSAVKLEGRRAYKLARRGDDVVLTTRTVEVYQLAMERYQYPELQLSIRCSSGTYVRSLGRDMAEALGTHAVMSALVRTAVGEFRLENSLDAKAINEQSLREHLLSPLTAVAHLPRVLLSPAQVMNAQVGGLFAVDELLGQGSLFTGALAAIDDRERLVALLKEARPGWLKPSPNFLQME